MDPDLLSLDDTPADALEVIDESEQEITRLRDEARRQTDDLRARAERACAEIESSAEEQIEAQQRVLLGQLKPLQDRYAAEGKLDEALAIRDRIRALKARLLQARDDPGSLAGELAEPGIEMLFDITGTTEGVVWGTDVYTADSRLAAAAVHAGILRDEERGIVRVKFVDALNVSFTASYRNGVQSMSFQAWPTGFRMSRV